MTAIIILLSIVAAFLAIPLFTALYFFNKRKKIRRNPLTTSLLRGPGETIRKELEVISEKLDDFFLLIIGLAVLSPLILIFVLKFGDSSSRYWQFWLVIVCYGLIIAGLTSWLYRTLRYRQDLYLGLDAETAVGQELNTLMFSGFRVFHDFPAENFNIDHVAVGPAGVFAVETKGRAKPIKGRGNVDAKVFSDGEVLRFPDWNETEPLEQARWQAKWLAKWLSSAVGQPVPVKPVLALPGWFVEMTKRSDVVVYSGKSPQFFSKLQVGEPLPESLVLSISHQLEQRCRDVAPAAYKR